GAFHTEMSQNYAFGKECYVGGVTPKKRGTTFLDIPVFETVAEAKKQTGATVSVIYVPPPFAAAAIDEAVEAEMDLVICITEGIPVRDMIRTRDRMNGRKTILVGPNCPGIITPDELKIGIMPGHIHRKGNIGVVSKSGTLTYESAGQLAEFGLGQSTVVGVGGDPVNGLKHIDVLKMFNDDPETEAVIMVGEIGGNDEETAARWAKDNMKKPIIGFIAGVTAPPGKRMGHAGAIISGGKGTAQEKLAVMEECGITVTRNPGEIGKTLKSVLK
ncbi:MAG: succinate--CoA ligase subunit alpha, partial [Oxalobacter sp.]|nr:succinate--CoA ligase subunit alpha [Oxalobacter sp.]